MKEKLLKEFINWCDEPISANGKDREEMFEKIWRTAADWKIKECLPTEDELKKFLENWVYAIICDRCGGGGQFENEKCENCNGQGLTEWRTTELNKAILDQILANKDKK